MRWLMLAVALAGCDDGGDDPAAEANDAAVAIEMDQGAEARVDATAPDEGVAPDAGAALDMAADMAPILDVDMAAAPVILRASEPYERDVDFDWIAAGQPSEARLRAVVEAGVPVISLRYPNEDPFDEAGLIESLGGSFTRYATSGADYDSVDFREGMYDLYEAAIAAGGTVYLHCASSNRVGASWALFHAERLGLDAEAALEKGRAAGLSGLEGRVRAILGL